MKKGISITVRNTAACPFYRIDVLWDDGGQRVANCTVLARTHSGTYTCVGLKDERCPLNRGPVTVHAK